MNSSRPFRVDIELTRRCNQACVHCMVDAGASGAPNAEMSLQQVVAVLEQLASEGIMVVQFTGGEPLLRHDLGPIFRAASQLGYCILLSTNGTLLNEEHADLIAKYRIRVEISLDGSTEDIHDKIRGWPGAFKAVLRGTERLRRLGCDFDLSTVLLKNNIHQIVDIAKLARGLGTKRLLLKLPRITGRLCSRKEELCASYNEIVSVISLINNEFARDPGALTIHMPTLPVHKPSHRSHLVFKCPAGTTKIGIVASGLVVPCLLLRKPLGVLPANSLAVLLEHRYVKAIREVQERGSPQCRGCMHLTTCRSGCRAASLSVGRGLVGRDPLCDFFGGAQATP